MQKIKVSLLALSITLLTPGCMSVPRTTIKFDPEKKSVDIVSPKDIALKGLHLSYVPATATNTASFQVDVESYEAKNNVEMLREVVKQNQETAMGGAKLLGNLLDMAK